MKYQAPFWREEVFSCTSDRNFRCFYTCEIILSHIPVPAHGKDKWTAARWPHVDSWRHCNVKITSPCHVSVYFGFSWESFSCFFQYKMRYLVVSKKKNPLFVWRWDEKIRPSWSPFVITRQALWCQIGDPQDGFFYPTFTLMMHSYCNSSKGYGKHSEGSEWGWGVVIDLKWTLS